MNLQAALDSLITFLGDYGLQKLFNKIDDVQGRINYALVRFYFLTLISTIALVFIGLSITSGLFLYICSIYGYTLPNNLQSMLYTLSATVFVGSFTLFIISFIKIRNTKGKSQNYLMENSFHEVQELIRSYKTANDDSNTSQLNKRMERLEDAMMLIAESLKTNEDEQPNSSSTDENQTINLQRRI